MAYPACDFCGRMLADFERGFLVLYSDVRGENGLTYPRDPGKSEAGREHAPAPNYSHADCGPDTGYAVQLSRLVDEGLDTPQGWRTHLHQKEWWVREFDDALVDAYHAAYAFSTSRPFALWLGRHKQEDTPAGRLARYVGSRGDGGEREAFFLPNELPAWQEWLRSQGAPAPIRQGFSKTWRAFEKFRRKARALPAEETPIGPRLRPPDGPHLTALINDGRMVYTMAELAAAIDADEALTRGEDMRPYVKLYRDGDNVAVSTNCGSEEQFIALASDALLDSTTSGAGIDELHHRAYLTQIAEIVCKLRGYKAPLVEEQRVLTAGKLPLAESTLLTSKEDGRSNGTPRPEVAAAMAEA